MHASIADRELYASFNEHYFQLNDPFSLFPLEVVVLCLKGFSRKATARCSEVSKLWYKTTSHSQIWENFVIASFGLTHPLYETNLDKFFYIALEKTHCAHTQKFHAGLVNYLYDRDIKKIAQCNSLCRKLNIIDSKRIWTDRGFSLIAENLKYLTSICIREKMQIPFGEISPLTKVDITGIKNLALSSPRLERFDLEIRGFLINRGWTKAIQMFVEHCPKLKHVRIANNLITDSDINTLVKYSKLVKTLEISGTGSLTQHCMADIKQISTLKKLIIKQALSFQIPTIVDIMANLPRLKVIVLKCSEIVRFQDVISVLKLTNTCQNLNKMVLCRHFNLIKNQDVSDLIDQISILRKVKIEFQ